MDAPVKEELGLDDVKSGGAGGVRHHREWDAGSCDSINMEAVTEVGARHAQQFYIRTPQESQLMYPINGATSFFATNAFHRFDRCNCSWVSYNSLSCTLCFHNLEGKARFVALFKMYVHFLVRDDHLVLQVPAGTPTEFRDDGVAVAEEVDVEVGVVAWLGRGELLVWGGRDGDLLLWRCIAVARDAAALLRPRTRALLLVRCR